MNNKVILFLNGEEPDKYPTLELYDKIYCTDGSYHYLCKNNIQPDVISGDFDSIDLKHITNKTVIIPTPDQNYTDFEKALQIILNDGHKNVDVYGASGKQQDHFIGNLNAAFKFNNQLEIKFFDNYSTYYFLENNSLIPTKVNQIISLIPFPSCEGITTNGLLYPLKNEKLSITNRIGTRNKSIRELIEISFTSGNLILFINH